MLIGLPAALFLFSCKPPDPTAPKQGNGSIATDNYANKALRYYYYIPLGVLKDRGSPHDVMVCLGGLGSPGGYFVDNKMRRLADEEHFIIVGPSFMFDGDNFEDERSYQYPAAWSGQAFIRILERLKSDEGLNVSKLYLLGISAGAQFLLRFSLLHPELVAACAAHAAGGPVFAATKNDVKYFIGIGIHDEPIRRQIAQDFVNNARALGMEATFREYEGGHELRPEQEDDSLDFLRKVHQGNK